MQCPLCHSKSSNFFFEITEKVFKVKKLRTYYQCSACTLTYLSKDQRLTAVREKERYDSHQNDLSQEGYKKFLLQLWQPLKEKLEVGNNGLDFGSGPQPALAELISQDGFTMDIYDPFYAPKEPLETYNFITCTEVFEHIYDLNSTLSKIDRLLKPAAWFGVMTDLFSEDIDFAHWRYRQDDTHICFLKAETLTFIAAKWDWVIRYSDEKRVVIFQKKI